MNNELTIYTDGGARGNPGPAGIGVVIYDKNGKIILKRSEYIGEQTNNQAEYQALVFALTEAQNLKAKKVSCFLDSELVVKQMQGLYRVKNKNILSLYRLAEKIAQTFAEVTYTHVVREENTEADLLVNKAIDKATK